MRKGVIVQLDQNAAHIFRTDGAFVTCPRSPHWRVGDVVTLSSGPRVRWVSALAVGAACLLMAFAFVLRTYYKPVAYVEISINPCVQMSLNRYDRVLHVTGLNDDGVVLMEGVSYRGLTLEEAYARLLNRLYNNGGLRDAYIRLAIANNNQENLDRIEQTLYTIMEKYMETENMLVGVQRFAVDEYHAGTSIPSDTPTPEEQTQMEVPTPTPDNQPDESTLANETDMPVSESQPDTSMQMPNGMHHNEGGMHGMWRDGWDD